MRGVYKTFLRHRKWKLHDLRKLKPEFKEPVFLYNNNAWMVILTGMSNWSFFSFISRLITLNTALIDKIETKSSYSL